MQLGEIIKGYILNRDPGVAPIAAACPACLGKSTETGQMLVTYRVLVDVLVDAIFDVLINTFDKIGDNKISGFRASKLLRDIKGDYTKDLKQ